MNPRSKQPSPRERRAAADDAPRKAGEPAPAGRWAPSPGTPTFWYAMGAVWLAIIGTQLWLDNSQIETIPYSQFLEQAKQGRVHDLKVSSEQISGELSDANSGERKRFRTLRVDPDVAESLSEEGIDFTGVLEETWLTRLLSWVLPLVILLAVWMFFLRRVAQGSGMGGGMLSVGKSKAKIYVEEEIDVSFDDVAGVDEAKEELREIIGFLQAPEKYGRLGARLPKGVLLVGPPGTGKTLLARAVAGEAGVPFFSISGSEFVEMFVGVGAARVRDLFDQARSRAPCIIFIDELDALGRARGIGPMSGGHDEKEQTLNQLLAELDGFDPSEGVILLAATNRPEILDAALLRAGRFDRQILVDRPDKQARIAILKVHLHRVELAPDVQPDAIAALTPGFTGADLANLVNEAALLATRGDAARITMEDFTRAIERIVAGLEKRNRLLNPHEREVTAFHEMGHALVARAIPGSDPVHKISIIPRGIGALGYTIQRPTEDRFLMSKHELMDKMAVLLGGRAAEGIVFGEVSTGAADDLAKVTDIARSMVTRYGMDESISMVSLESERAPFLQLPGEHALVRREYSEQTAREVDCAVRELVQAASERAVELLKSHRGALEEGARLLLEKETLSGEELPTLSVVPALSDLSNE